MIARYDRYSIIFIVPKILTDPGANRISPDTQAGVGKSFFFLSGKLLRDFHFFASCVTCVWIYFYYPSKLSKWSVSAVCKSEKRTNFIAKEICKETRH